MSRLDKLVLQELIGPWAFGVAMFTVLIVAATYLFKLTDYLVQGIPLSFVLELSLMYLPGILVKTFAMATLLAALLGFTRLSNDSEVVAMRAAGASIGRMVLPVGLAASLVALVAFGLDETLVPWAAKRTVGLLAEVAVKLNPSSLNHMSQPIEDHGKILGVVDARNYDQLRQVFVGVTIIVYDAHGDNAGYLAAKELAFDPTKFAGGGGWRIQGGATWLSADGKQVIRLLGDAFPPGVPQPQFSPTDVIASSLTNLDLLSMREIRARVRTLEHDPGADPKQIPNLEYGYWNKLALPLAAVVYGLLGAPLGIRTGRATAAGGFALAVAIIFGYVTLGNLLNVYAMGGVLPAWVASFAPLVVGVVAAAAIMRLRNR